MNAYDRKILLKAYKRNVSEWLTAGNMKRLESEYREKQQQYFYICDTLEGRSHSKNFKEYVRNKYQVISDAFIFKVDPLTGLNSLTRS